MNHRLLVMVCLTRIDTRSPAVCGAAELAGHSCRVLAVDPFSAVRPRWLPAAVNYLPRPKAVPLYLYMAATVNEVIAGADEDIIALVDDDVIVTSSALTRHVQAQRAAGGAIVVTPVAGGRIHPGYALDMAWMEQVAPWALTGACWSVPVSALRDAGGFDRHASMVTRGDEDAAWRLWSGGLPVVLDRAFRLEREAAAYPGSRWRGSAHQQLGRRHGGAYASAWDEVCRLQTRITDHNRYHDRRAIAGSPALRRLSGELAGPGFSHTVAVPAYTEDDAIRALALADKHELLILDRSPVSQSHLVAARGAAGGARVVRDELMLAAGALAAMGLRLGPRSARDQSLETLRKVLWRERERIMDRWPRWLAATAGGDTVSLVEPPADTPRTGRMVRKQAVGASQKWEWGPFEQGYAGPPRAVAIRITNRCNLRCVMCGQHGPTGNMAGVREAELPAGELRGVVSQAASAGVGMFHVWGGEPFLRPDAIDLLRAASCAGLFTVVTTNGYFLRELASDLVSIPLDCLRLSLDGPPEVHDRIRNCDGLFDRVWDGLMELRRLKQARGRQVPAVEIECTISPHNYRHLAQMVPIAVEAGAHALNLSQLVYADRGESRRRDALFSRLFGQSGRTSRGYWLDVDLDYEELARTMSGLTAPGQPLPVNFTPSLPTPGAVRAHYTQPYAVYGRKHCTAPWIWAEVHPAGDMFFCDDFHDIALGNIARASLREVYNGDTARRYRRELLQRGRFPGCITCGLLNMDGVY